MGSTWYRIATDQVGSVKYVMEESNGTPFQNDEYDPWGAVTSGSFYYVPFGFAGGLYDPDTKQVHFGAREYDPAVGRWISKDPIRFDGGQENLHVYAGNDPVNRTDSNGSYAENPDGERYPMDFCSCIAQAARHSVSCKIDCLINSHPSQYAWCVDACDGIAVGESGVCGDRFSPPANKSPYTYPAPPKSMPFVPMPAFPVAPRDTSTMPACY